MLSVHFRIAFSRYMNKMILITSGTYSITELFMYCCFRFCFCLIDGYREQPITPLVSSVEEVLDWLWRVFFRQISTTGLAWWVLKQFIISQGSLEVNSIINSAIIVVTYPLARTVVGNIGPQSFLHESRAVSLYCRDIGRIHPSIALMLG